MMHDAELDPGLKEALDAAGGIRGLARLLGLAPVSVFEWRQVPARRLLDVEKVTGVQRHVLRPELYRDYVRKK